MSEETPSFQPHSDEDLARLLEEQMRLLRGQTPQPSVEEPVVAPEVFQPPAPPAAPPAPAASFSTPVVDEVEDSGIDALFGSLLEDTSEVKVVVEDVQEELFQPAIRDEELEHTQPLPTIITEEATEVFEEDDHVVVVEESTELVVEDAQLIAERVISAISLDGEVVAAEAIEATFAEPIPSMFGDVDPSTPVATVSEVGVEFASVDDLPLDETASIEVPQSALTPDVVEVPEVQKVLTSVTQFAPRPSFDELVFGADTEDSV